MIIHVTREIGQVVISGANGNGEKVRTLLQRWELKQEIARRPNDPVRLSQEELKIFLKQALIEVFDEEIQLFIH